MSGGRRPKWLALAGRVGAERGDGAAFQDLLPAFAAWPTDHRVYTFVEAEAFEGRDAGSRWTSQRRTISSLPPYALASTCDPTQSKV